MALGISSRLQPFALEGIPVYELRMLMRLKRTLSLVFRVSGFASAELCENRDKTFYAELNSVLDERPP